MQILIFLCFQGRKRYRCDSEHRAYCTSLVERYEVPPAQEATNEVEEFNPNSLPSIASMFAAPMARDDVDLLRHTVLLLLLLASMFIGTMNINLWQIFHINIGSFSTLFRNGHLHLEVSYGSHKWNLFRVGVP